LRWIRESWKGPIIIKGVLIADDARRAVDEGTSAIVVSNHGARQLDCVLPIIRALPEIVAAVGGKTEILMDGGIRRGSDIVKALCLGARAVLIGRAYAYGLAAHGQAGVERAIKILRDDVESTLRLLGCGSVQELNTSFIECPCEWRKVADALVNKSRVPVEHFSSQLTQSFGCGSDARTGTNLKPVAARPASTRTRPAFGVMGAIQDRFVASRWKRLTFAPR
jgi:hypothetical protein